tara:strand:+ start:23225 stop:23599 length:375 start_codon:yes stop_codon:yes gene_type:complete
LAGKKYFYLGIAGCYTIAITILFLLPPSGTEAPFPQADKVIHVILYLILMLVWTVPLLAFRKKLNIRNVSLLLIALLFYGIIIEVIQAKIIDGRQGDVLDVIANLLGSILGLFLFTKLQEYLPK